MAITITDGTNTIDVMEVTGYEATSQTKNVYHTPGAVSLAGEGPRAGTLPLVFPTLTDAAAAWEVLAAPEVFTFTYHDLTALTMTFVRDGEMTLRIDPQQRARWRIDLGYREVEP